MPGISVLTAAMNSGLAMQLCGRRRGLYTSCWRVFAGNALDVVAVLRGREMDFIDQLIINLHSLLGHEKCAAVLGVDPWPGDVCLLCVYEETPTDENAVKIAAAFNNPNRVKFDAGKQVSLKCRLYGTDAHSPCSGTTDDGRKLPCKCWCHCQIHSRGGRKS